MATARASSPSLTSTPPPVTATHGEWLADVASWKAGGASPTPPSTTPGEERETPTSTSGQKRRVLLLRCVDKDAIDETKAGIAATDAIANVVVHSVNLDPAWSVEERTLRTVADGEALAPPVSTLEPFDMLVVTGNIDTPSRGFNLGAAPGDAAAPSEDDPTATSTWQPSALAVAMRAYMQPRGKGRRNATGRLGVIVLLASNSNPAVFRDAFDTVHTVKGFKSPAIIGARGPVDPAHLHTLTRQLLPLLLCGLPVDVCVQQAMKALEGGSDKALVALRAAVQVLPMQDRLGWEASQKQAQDAASKGAAPPDAGESKLAHAGDGEDGGVAGSAKDADATPSPTTTTPSSSSSWSFTGVASTLVRGAMTPVISLCGLWSSPTSQAHGRAEAAGQVRVLTSFERLAESNDMCHRLLHRPFHLQNVVQRMRVHPTDAVLQATALRLLATLARDPITRPAVAHADALLPTVTMAMRAHGDDATVQRHACDLLHSLTGIPRSVAAVAATDGLTAAVATSMHTHAALAQVVTHACTVFIRLEQHGHSDDVATTEGLTPALVAGMTAHETDTAVQGHVIDLLCRLCQRDDVVERIGSTEGMLAAVFAAMMGHRGEVELQRDACGVLFLLSSNAGVEEAMVKMPHLLPALVAGMAPHVADAETQRRGMATLGNLSHNVVIAGQLHGVEGLYACTCAAMTRHPADGAIQRCACTMLMNACGSGADASAALLTVNGAVAGIAASMLAHVDDAEVQRKACGVLLSLSRCEGSTEPLNDVGELLPALLSSMAAHPDDHAIQSRSLGVLGTLAKSEAGVVTMAERQDLAACVQLARVTHATNVTVQRNALQLLTLLHPQ